MFESEIIKEVRNTFTVGHEEEDSFKYVGMNMTCDKAIIQLDQIKYTQNIDFIKIEKERASNKEDQLNEIEKREMRGKIGQLLWLSRQSRPDLSYDASELASRVNFAKVKDITDTNKKKKTKGERVTLKFKKLENPCLMIFTDASLGNCSDGGTQGGYFLCLKDKTNNITLLSWNSKKLRRVARSTLTAETLAMTEGMDTGIYAACLYSELLFGKPTCDNITTKLITDGQSLFDAIESNKSVQEKRLRMEIASIKGAISKKQISKIEWVNTENQLADCLTKKGSSPLKLLKALEKGMIEA